MSKTLPGFSLNSFISPAAQAGDWYKNVGYEDSKNLIKEKIVSSAENFVAIGYYLKHIDETGQYKEGGYKNIWECAKEEFGFSQAKASRLINICKKYSVDGNSPYINERFKGFDKSQLQEMLPIKDDNLIEQITPEMSTREIRNVKNAGDTKDVTGDEVVQGQMQITTIDGEYREFVPTSDIDDNNEKSAEDAGTPRTESPADVTDSRKDEPASAGQKSDRPAGVDDVETAENEVIQLTCNDENAKEAVEFIFDYGSFPQNTMDELVELFRQGNDEHTGYNTQTLIFGKMLPYKSDTVEVTYECGYLVRYIHTDEWIRIPVNSFWRIFGKHYEWIWKEASKDLDSPDENIQSGNGGSKCYDLERIKVPLPCTVNETVYFYDGNSTKEGIINQITLRKAAETQFRVYCTEDAVCFFFEASDFGIFLFYTYEEAEEMHNKVPDRCVGFHE